MITKTYLTVIISMILVSGQYFIKAEGITSELPITERNNKNSTHLDSLSALEIATLMNNEDSTIAAAITPCLPHIGEAIEKITEAFRADGRLIYVGAGSSGRLGVMDASECVTTFSAGENQVLGIIVGGDRALRTTVEGVEDDGGMGKQSLIQAKITSKDIVCGISASGEATSVTEALKYAKSVGCYTIFIGCNGQAAIGQGVNCFIAAEVGPEILTGSTRLKAGTATKMILNMLTTGAFTRYGKVYKNLMVDVKPVNKKLVKRCHRIIAEICDIDELAAAQLFGRAENKIKVAVLMHMFGIGCKKAHLSLVEHKGLLREAIKAMHAI